MRSRETMGDVEERDPGRELRRYRNLMYVSGMAVIGFGIWSSARVLISFSIDMGEFAAQSLQNDLISEVPVWLINLVMVSVVLIITAIPALIRLYIGTCAISESKGIKSRVVYLVVVVIYTVLDVAMIISGGYDIITGLSEPGRLMKEEFNLGDRIVSLISEIISLTAFVELFFAAVVVKRLVKNQETG